MFVHYINLSRLDYVFQFDKHKMWFSIWAGEVHNNRLQKFGIIE